MYKKIKQLKIQTRLTIAFLLAAVMLITALASTFVMRSTFADKAHLVIEAARGAEQSAADEELEGYMQTVSSAVELVGGWLNTMIVFYAVIIAAILFWFFLQRYRVFKPLKGLLGAAEKMAGGDVDFDSTMIESNDEISALYNVFSEIHTNLKAYAETLNRVAQYDLTVEAVSRSENDFVAQSLKDMLAHNNETLSQISVSAENVANASKAMLASGEALSKSAMSQAGAIEEITATVTEIAIQSKQISENSAVAKELSDNITRFADEGNRKMKSLLESMEAINDAAGNISKIIKAIDEISFKTNMLALNASVEAARAGEQGKGFAVVASEVRELAGRSAKAAKETESLIGLAVDSVSDGTRVAGETAKMLSKILDEVNKNAPLIESISVATNEQYIGIEQANQAIEQVANTTEKNSKFAEESAGASKELTMQSQLLREMVLQYKILESDNEQEPGEEEIIL